MVYQRCGLTLILLACPVLARAQETRLVQRHGQTYRETYHTEMQPVEETVYRRQFTTELRERHRRVIVPVTQYRWEARVHHWWNPFRRNTVAYQNVPRTHLEQRIQTDHVRVTVPEWKPVQRVTHVPVRVVDRSDPVSATGSRVATLPPSQRRPPIAASTNSPRIGGLMQLNNDPPRYGTQTLPSGGIIVR